MQSISKNSPNAAATQSLSMKIGDGLGWTWVVVCAFAAMIVAGCSDSASNDIANGTGSNAGRLLLSDGSTMTFGELASCTGGGVQTPGFMGHGRHFISSKKFLAAEGGYAKMAEYLQSAWPKLFGEDKFKVKDGYMEIPDGPGWGVELAPDLEEKHPFKPISWRLDQYHCYGGADTTDKVSSK